MRIYQNALPKKNRVRIYIKQKVISVKVVLSIDFSWFFSVLNKGTKELWKMVIGIDLIPCEVTNTRAFTMTDSATLSETISFSARSLFYFVNKFLAYTLFCWMYRFSNYTFQANAVINKLTDIIKHFFRFDHLLFSVILYVTKRISFS